MNGTVEDERQRLVKLTFELTKRYGRSISVSDLAAETRIARTRLLEIFEDDNALFDGIVEEWFAPKLAIMDEVMASDLPSRRKLYEFVARRYVQQRDQFRADPTGFRVFLELGEQHFERARSYIDLADHYMCELIAQAQADGYFEGLELNDALSLINQMLNCYIQPINLTYMDARLNEEKLGRIVDAMFDGLSGEDRGAKSVSGLRAAT